MGEILVSIVIPAYNREKLVGRAIESCLRQSYRNIEIIVCDDHSADETRTVVQKYANIDNRVRCCVSPEGKKGANAARNQAIRKSAGELICFLDSDDELVEDSIIRRVRCFERNPNIGMAYGDVYSDENKKRVEIRFQRIPTHRRLRREWLLKELSLCITSGIMVKKSVFDRIGFLNEEQKAWQDDWLCVSCGMDYPLVHCGEFVAWVHPTPGSIVGNKDGSAQGLRILLHRFGREIIREVSLQRFLLWIARLVMAYAYAAEMHSNHAVTWTAFRVLHLGIRKRIRPFFTNWYE